MHENLVDSESVAVPYLNERHKPRAKRRLMPTGSPSMMFLHESSTGIPGTSLAALLYLPSMEFAADPILTTALHGSCSRSTHFSTDPLSSIDLQAQGSGRIMWHIFHKTNDSNSINEDLKHKAIPRA